MKNRTISIVAIGAIAVLVSITALFYFGLFQSTDIGSLKAFNVTGSRISSGHTESQKVSQAREDGAIDIGEEVSVFDDNHPAVTNLNPELLAAVRAAANDARDYAGYKTTVGGGWRSPAYQRLLLKNAVRDYGSAEEAARWVATPETSSHVFGDAVDLGPTDVMYWVQQHGSQYGLCQTYGNEIWHYELVPAAVTEGCPIPYADPSEDPRLQRRG